MVKPDVMKLRCSSWPALPLPRSSRSPLQNNLLVSWVLVKLITWLFVMAFVEEFVVVPVMASVVKSVLGQPWSCPQ